MSRTRALIIDPSFSAPSGHHYAHHLAIGAALARRGFEARIFANKQARAETVEDVAIVPAFQHDAYASLNRDKIINDFAGFNYFNALFESELRALPHDSFTSGDVVLFPTTSEIHLMGIVRWAAALEPDRRPEIVVYLVLTCGVEADENDYVVTEPLKALFYRLCFERDAAAETRIRFFAGGRQLVADYAALSRRAITSHPLPISLGQEALRSEPEDRTMLLFTGESRTGKNIELMPDVVRGLLQRLPSWNFVIHAHASRPWHLAKPVEALRQIGANEARLEFHTGFLSSEMYGRLFAKASTVAILYHPDAYRRASSAVLWEALSIGRPVLVAAETWLVGEAAFWGASYAAVPTRSAAEIVDGVVAAVGSGNLDSSLARDAAVAFRSVNGVDAVADHMLQMAGAAESSPTSANL